MKWVEEHSSANGYAYDTASDDFGVLGTPGTWTRVRKGNIVKFCSRNRGDALRYYQRHAR